jgi:hypothetical protein
MESYKCRRSSGYTTYRSALHDDMPHPKRVVDDSGKLFGLILLLFLDVGILHLPVTFSGAQERWLDRSDKVPADFNTIVVRVGPGSQNTPVDNTLRLIN